MTLDTGHVVQGFSDQALCPSTAQVKPQTLEDVWAGSSRANLGESGIAPDMEECLHDLGDWLFCKDATMWEKQAKHQAMREGAGA